MITENGAMTFRDRALFRAAWDTARAQQGDEFTFYLPGMVRYGHQRGRYPAISITGENCQLMCEHCKGQLLQPMIKIAEPDELIKKCRRLSRAGSHGVLLSGGSDRKGRLPWERYYGAIRKVKQETDLFISAHVGFPDLNTCQRLREAGVEQALIDVMGDSDTARRVYHLRSLEQVLDALESISRSGLQLVPHIVAGLLYGHIGAEYQALEMISQYQPSALVIVVLTPLKGTPMAHVTRPSPLEVGRLIASARLLLPEIPISLGCERPRDKEGLIMERLAVLAGANRMAVWSEEAVKTAVSLGLKPRFQPTCCSLEFREEFSQMR